MNKLIEKLGKKYENMTKNELIDELKNECKRQTCYADCYVDLICEDDNAVVFEIGIYFEDGKGFDLKCAVEKRIKIFKKVDEKFKLHTDTVKYYKDFH